MVAMIPFSLLTSASLYYVALVNATPLYNIGARGAVASESLVCSAIGGDVLKQGGNAADAMIATVLCVGTVDAHHSGIGGGGFALVRSPRGNYSMIDFRETAPALANETMYSNNTDPTASTIGGLSIGVPGELRGLETLHKRYGKLPWKALFQPAIKLADEGFVVQPQLAGALQSSSSLILNDPAFAAVFTRNGSIIRYGDTAYRPTYAKTLKAIAEHGACFFYDRHSWIAQATVDAAQRKQGILTLDDLDGYKVEIRKPASIQYRGYQLTSTVAPSSGTVVLSALNILRNYNLSYVEQGGQRTDSNITAQRLVESMKFAYGQRTVLGDPKFVTNVTALELGFLRPSVGADIREKIRDNSTGPPEVNDAHYVLPIAPGTILPVLMPFTIQLYDPTGYEVLETHGTSHITTADSSGLVISLTTTVNLYFGSQIMVPETGVILNDEMDDFSSPGSSNAFGYIATPSNYIVPGKRPLSSISPTIVDDKDGNFVFAVGAAGGSRIITANLQVLHHYLDHGLTAQQSINAPRIHDQIFPQVTTFEYPNASQNVTGYNNGTTAYLAAIGHNVTFVAPGVSVSAAIGFQNGKFDAAADPRVPGSGHVVV